MKIVVAGATSFIGKRLVGFLNDRNHEIVAVVRRSSEKISFFDGLKNVIVVECNFDEYYKLGYIIKNADCFVHLTWDGVRGDKRFDEQLQRSNYEFSMQAIKSMIEIGVSKIITAGSQAEYGLINEMISEDTPCNPNTAYGVYKVKLFEDAYKLCKEKNISFKEPRYFSLYGPNDYEKSLIMTCVKNMLSNADCELTECNQIWDFMYIDDAINALICLIERDCADGAYNFASGDQRPLKNYVNEMKKVLNSNSNLHFGSIPYTKAGVISIKPSIEKLKKEINFNPSISFKDGILQIAKSLK